MKLSNIINKIINAFKKDHGLPMLPALPAPTQTTEQENEVLKFKIGGKFIYTDSVGNIPCRVKSVGKNDVTFSSPAGDLMLRKTNKNITKNEDVFSVGDIVTFWETGMGISVGAITKINAQTVNIRHKHGESSISKSKIVKEEYTIV